MDGLAAHGGFCGCDGHRAVNDESYVGALDVLRVLSNMCRKALFSQGGGDGNTNRSWHSFAMSSIFLTSAPSVADSPRLGVPVSTRYSSLSAR